jgi:hypothetical protein
VAIIDNCSLIIDEAQYRDLFNEMWEMSESGFAGLNDLRIRNGYAILKRR